MGPGIQGPKILQNISFKAAWFWRGLRVVKNEAKGPRPSKVRKSSPILGPALPCLQKTPAGVGIAWIWRGFARGKKSSPFRGDLSVLSKKKTRHI